MRDLSFSITDYSKASELQSTVFSFKDKILKDIFIFDYFNNQKKHEIKIGFRFIFQSKDKTITVDQVDNIMQDIIKVCLNIKSVSIPGLE